MGLSTRKPTLAKTNSPWFLEKITYRILAVAYFLLNHGQFVKARITKPIYLQSQDFEILLGQVRYVKSC